MRNLKKKKKKDKRASLAIQQLRLHASNAGGAGSISSQDCTQCGQKIKFNFKEIQMNLCTKQKYTYRYRKQIYGYQRGKLEGRDEVWD